MSSLVSALKSKLASSTDYDKLIQSSSVGEVLDFLQAKYSSILVLREPGDEVPVQRSINNDYRAAVRRIQSLSPPGLRKLIQALMHKEELEAVSSVLRGIAQEVDSSSLVASVAPFGEYDEETIRQLAETRPLRRTVEALRDQELKETLLTSLGELGANTTSAVDLSVQHVFARRLWRAMKLFLMGRSAEDSKRILGQWFDLQNLLLVTRSRRLGVRTDALRSFIIPVHYRLPLQELDVLIAASSLAETFAQISKTQYGKALSSLSPGSPGFDVSTLEVSFNRYFAGECFRAFSGWRFSAGPPVAFVFLKQLEAEDLQAILTGKVKGLPPEEIRRNIILYQESPGPL